MQFTVAQLDDAYRWLCRQRKHFPPDADVWHFRFRYPRIKHALLWWINAGQYRFSPQQKIVKSDGEIIHLWGAQDVLVMKLMASILVSMLPISSRCTHVKGHGGLKQSIVEVQNRLHEYRFVCKTDVKHFYETIDQYRLMEMIHDSVRDTDLRYYLYQVIHRTVESGGEYKDIDSGISRGCPLSPLLGALYLKALDDSFAGTDAFYLRYMDDILILSKTRWQNRKAVIQLNGILNRLKLEKHLDKTFIGRIEKGFDFLGYHFSRKPLQVAEKTVEKHVLHIVRLYEQLRQKKATSKEMASTLGLYVNRWQRWAVAGLQGIKIDGLSSHLGLTSAEPDQSDQGRAE
ncbi:reverse transcriptase domain-containing protein [Gammaproteobacteria bacterium]|nr:reverse transcriptase domain-containing protein [Gammaproteobacteria bacterium]